MAYRVSQSADFEKYEQLGLSYDKESGYLLYDNKKVGYFMDEKAEGVYTRFVDEAGEIGVSIARDNQREIVDIVDFPMSEVHFDDDIATVEESTSSDKSEAVYAMAYEENDETVSDVSKEYMEYGITVNAAEGAWSYNGKTVAALYDAGRKIYIYNGNTNNDTVYIHVIRDKSGKIEALEEITKEAMQSLLKNTDTELLIEEKIQLLELELEQMETENTSLKEKISDTEDEMKLLENESARGTDKENEVKILLKEKEQLTEKQRIVEKQIETLTDERKAIQKSAE